MTKFGYIYKITLPDDRFYIGKKESSVVVPNYFGSGSRTKKWCENISNAKKGMFSGQKNPMFGIKGKDNPNFGSIWVSNGEITIKIKKNKQIPYGYHRGRK